MPLEIGVEGIGNIQFFDWPKNGLNGKYTLKGSFSQILLEWNYKLPDTESKVSNFLKGRCTCTS
jgi:hypothetical protein